MSSFRHIPLGRAIPDRPHAVSVSLPTMADLIGYETKDPAVIRHVLTGYPRFVLHPFVRRLTEEFARRQGLQGWSVWLTASRGMAERLSDWLGGEARVVVEGELTAVACSPEPERSAKAKSFLQHCGGFLSSRQAEDMLVAAGLVPAPVGEVTELVDPLGVVKGALRRAFSGARDEDLFITASGMNAVYSAFAAVNEVQAPRGRTVWIQLGWLYSDTISILGKFTAKPPADHVIVSSVNNLDDLRRELEVHRGKVAGIITEVPTNPLVRSCDVPALSLLAREHGALLLLDASIASPWNIDALRHADIAMASLTKYAAAEGDVIAGAVAVNPDGRDADSLRAAVSARVCVPYQRDIARLAHEIGDVDRVVTGLNAATERIVRYLSSRPEVVRVHWAMAEESRAAFEKVRRPSGGPGCMISFELKPGLFARFYDAVRLPKGPSFGICETLLCPFLYLAHFELVNRPEGRAVLLRHGLNPELLRLSVGLEPVDQILGALEEAFGVLKTC